MKPKEWLLTIEWRETGEDGACYGGYSSLSYLAFTLISKLKNWWLIK